MALAPRIRSLSRVAIKRECFEKVEISTGGPKNLNLESETIDEANEISSSYTTTRQLLLQRHNRIVPNLQYRLVPHLRVLPVKRRLRFRIVPEEPPEIRAFQSAEEIDLAGDFVAESFGDFI